MHNTIRQLAGFISLLTLSGCFHLPEENNTPAVQVSGKIADGPVASASLSSYDANGALISQKPNASDAQGNYQIAIPYGTAYPVILQAEGGIDQITQLPLEGRLTSIVLPPTEYQVQVNINPTTTLITHLAQQKVDHNNHGISNFIADNATQVINQAFDLSTADPLRTQPSEEQWSQFYRDQKRISETVRRASTDILRNYAYAPYMINSIYEHIAEDLVDSKLDGIAGSHDFISMNYLSALNQVKREINSGTLNITNSFNQQVQVNDTRYIEILASPASISLDTREAHVLDINYSSERFELSVTLLHNDDGESGFADWWQVESLNGQVFARYDINVAQGNSPTTTTFSIAIPSGVTTFVVRAHDQTHGYGGNAIIYNIESHMKIHINQGVEPLDFSHYSF